MRPTLLSPFSTLLSLLLLASLFLLLLSHSVEPQPTTTTTTTTTTTSVSQSFPPTLTLEVTYRDFNEQHPDFECCSNAPEKGIVAVDLGSDGTPVYAAKDTCQVGSSSSSSSFEHHRSNMKNLAVCGPSSNGHTTHGAKPFYDWFHDTKGKGILGTYHRTIELKLIDAESGVYDYTNFMFFPLNDLGKSFPTRNSPVTGHPACYSGYTYDYNVRDQNFGFTTHISTHFVYRPGQNFTFMGDDDVWVFINKKLVIDLGGVHTCMEDSVDLDTLGLTAGSVYQLDVFNAERHTDMSNFKLTTTICFDTCPGGACRPDETKCEDRITSTPDCTYFVCSSTLGSISKKKKRSAEQLFLGGSTTSEGTCIEVYKSDAPASCYVAPSPGQ